MIDWVERERLVAEFVEFAGLSLHPTKYEEEEQDGDVAITFRATLSEQEMSTVWELREARGIPERRYVQVVRQGVSEEPRKMRLGRVLWQKQADAYEHSIVLVDATIDEKDPGPWAGMRAEPELGHLVAGQADLLGQIEALLEALEGAGAIDGEARAHISQAGSLARKTRERSFFEVDDLSRWQ